MIQQEIDGVPALFHKTAGPYRAGLMFRVGRQDESLPTAGITHLAEHLALFRHGLMDHHANASVSQTRTHFYTSGTAEQVVAFFTKLCATLADLPLERLAVEKEILQIEEAGRSGGVNLRLLQERFGAQGPGLAGYAELGLHRITADDLRAWVVERFTRDNAVFWLAGEELPADLRLNLPAGKRYEVPRSEPIVTVTPAYFHARTTDVVMDTLVPAGPASQVFAHVLERALYRDLRLDGGVSYSTSTDYALLTDDVAILVAAADALPEKQSAVLHGFVETVKVLSRRGIDEEELAAVRGKLLDTVMNPEYDAARLPGVASDLLAGRPVESAAEQAAKLRAVTVDDVLAVAREAYANALLQVPATVRAADSLGFAPTPKPKPLDGGRKYASRSNDGCSLVIGSAGVGIVDGSGDGVAVRYADCVARLEWPDGGSLLIGRDGVVVSIEPTLYKVDDAALATIHGSVPAGVTIPMPARKPDQIPRPARSGPAPRPARKIEFSILAPLTAVLLWGFIAMANAWKPSDGALSEKLLLLMMVLVALGTIRVGWLLILRLKLGRW